jgi:hypothetical protein
MPDDMHEYVSPKKKDYCLTYQLLIATAHNS